MVIVFGQGRKSYLDIEGVLSVLFGVCEQR